MTAPCAGAHAPPRGAGDPAAPLPDRVPPNRRTTALGPLVLLALLLPHAALAASGDVEARTLRVASGSSPSSKVQRVAALCVSPSDAAGVPLGAHATPLLLLHGASFNAHTWLDLGTLASLSGVHHTGEEPVVLRDVCAVDLPKTLTAGQGATGDVIMGILDALAWKTAFVVAPSASGRLLWPCLLSEASSRRFAGVVSVAAVGFDAYAERLAVSSAAARTPTLLVWGERDNPDGAAAKAQQRTFARSRKVVLRGAGHACYLDAPDEFHSHVAAWMSDVERHAPPMGQA